VTGWHRHRHRPGPTLRVDTTNEGWGLLTGHQRGPTPGHQRGLSHGHGQRAGRVPRGREAPDEAPRGGRLKVARGYRLHSARLQALSSVECPLDSRDPVRRVQRRCAWGWISC
jgi:hypothetical protein